MKFLYRFPNDLMNQFINKFILYSKYWIDPKKKNHSVNEYLNWINPKTEMIGTNPNFLLLHMSILFLIVQAMSGTINTVTLAESL